MLAALASQDYVSTLTGAMIEINDSLSSDTPDYRRPELLPRDYIMPPVFHRPVIIGDWILSCVFYPDLLGQLLFTVSVDQRDILRMIARCLEHTADEHFGLDSLRILLRYARPTSRIHLQPWRYAVDSELYAR